MKGTIYPRPFKTVTDPRTGKTARKPVRGSTWTFQYAVVVNGKRRTMSKGGFRTRADCQEALTKALASGERVDAEKAKMPLRQLLQDEWMPLQRLSKKPSTLRGYADMIKNRIVPHLGATPIRKITSGDVAKLYGTLREAGLSEQSIKHTHNVLQGAMEHAVEEGWLARNPVRSITRAVRPQPQRATMKFWTGDEAKAFLASIEGDRLAPLCALALTTGMRRGEILGLRWADLDLDRGAVAVRRSRVPAGYDVHEGTPKTGKERNIALDTDTVAMMRKLRLQQRQERMAAGPAWTESDMVFTKEDGSPPHPNIITDMFNRRVKAAKVPRIRFHDLRHTHAVIGLQCGVHPKVMQERLGHSSISVTLDIYSHVAPGMQEDAAAKIGTAILGRGA
jgi:integrase